MGETKCNLCGKDCSINESLSLYSKSGGFSETHNQFCSNDCKDLFKKTKKCWFCLSTDNLVQVPEIGCMVCTIASNRYRNSCLDEYNLRKLNNLDLLHSFHSEEEYDEMRKSYHERIWDLKKDLSDSNRRIDDLEYELSKTNGRLDELEQMFQQSLNKNE